MIVRTLLNLAFIVLLLFIGVRAYLHGEGPHLPGFTRPLSGIGVIPQPAPAPAPAEVQAEAQADSAEPKESLAPQAEPVAEKFSTAMHYAVTLSGFPVADIYVGLQSRPNGDVEARSMIRSSGIADIAGGYKSDTTTVAQTPGGYGPVSYQTQFKLKGDWRTIKLAYSKTGDIVQPEYNEPPEKRWKRAEVPAAQKNGTFDPLTAALAAREKLKQLSADGKLAAGNKFSLPLYDGRRRADLVFTMLGKTKRGNISLSFAEIPIAGYTNNEIEGFSENQHVITIEVSSENFMPVRASGNTVLGMAEARLAKQCATLEECMQ